MRPTARDPSLAERWTQRLVDVHGPAARDVLEGILVRMTTEQLAELRYDWAVWARPKQVFPVGAWRVLLVLAGRSWGKTRAQTEWLQGEISARRVERFLLIGRTEDDAVKVLVKGNKSGLLAIAPPWFKPRFFEADPKRLEYPNGAVGYIASAEQPNSVRGENLDAILWDEVAACDPRNAAEVMYNGRMALRARDRARFVLTTTSKKRRPMLREILEKSRTSPDRYRVIGGNTLENKTNPKDFVDDLIAEYSGTELWRQELEGGILDDEAEGALWRATWIRHGTPPTTFVRVVVAVDPAVSVRHGSDETGIVALGLAADGTVWVLEDASGRYSPDRWPREVWRLVSMHGAGLVVVETNRGGNLVTHALTAERDRVPGCRDVGVREVRAENAKETRADPVAALYERGRVAHVGGLAALEDQMLSWDPRREKSPDRIDALVWGVWELIGDSLGEYSADYQRANVALAAPRAGTLRQDESGAGDRWGKSQAYEEADDAATGFGAAGRDSMGWGGRI